MLLPRRTVLLGLAATALTPRDVAAQDAPEAQRVPVELVEDALALEGLVRVGAAAPDITMLEFFDYNCPHCRRSAEELPDLLGGDPDLAYGLVNFAVLGEPSVEASRVALGFFDLYGPERTLVLHRALFAMRGVMNGRRAFDAAVAHGADGKRLLAATDSAKVTGWMKAALAVGDALGLSATPSFVVGPEAYVGYVPLAAKSAILARARA